MTTAITGADLLAPTSTARQIADVVAAVCRHLGWRDGIETRTRRDDLALLHSEVSEALEAYRRWGYDDATIGEPIRTTEGKLVGIPKPEGVGSELADVAIRLLDVYERRQNLPRPSWWDRPLADVAAAAVFESETFGDLIADLHHAIAIDDLEEVVPHVVAMARRAKVDLFEEIARKIRFNVTRSYRHGGKRL